MIGFLSGKVLRVDEATIIVQTDSGVGHQVYFGAPLKDGQHANLYITHLFRENSQDLYGFLSMEEKNLFELLIKVKGVGPKSAQALTMALGPEALVRAVQMENRKALVAVAGIGPRVASQILLDLSSKMDKLKALSRKVPGPSPHPSVMEEAMMACRELGFSEEKVAPIALKILSERPFEKSEQLLQQVLREI